ncbi:4'-phosphopantetheinyl transferase family protein [Saccharibacillus alkalitolerans]|uniref:4'-phosphopantetheinyl transferase superfamily protein n=1 Tax=Saccharibacillus alkalitolerans TaxID=2705290 RepID=A0ABX0F9F2_9BACL|nr:4'-phosphopantetheinyl transferase superfamily protein [Saccharibacillus alkalitolerans]NGZ77571.1 4'-phosphopantetheinyl transferase superfamily protein [Saccharibacillus alkalitolerans]
MHAVFLHRLPAASDWNRLISAFLPAERARIQRLKREEDRLLKAASHMLVSVLLGERMGIGYEDLPFRRGVRGKPYLAADASPSFGISRSGRLAVCALADTEVGIDVERRDFLDADTVRALLGRSAGASGERRAAPDELQFFYERWTMLESWLKAEGTGLTDERTLASFEPRTEEAAFRVEASEAGADPWMIDSYSLVLPDSERYALALCRRPEERRAAEVEFLEASVLERRFRMLL